MVGHRLRVLILIDADQEFDLVRKVLREGGYDFEPKQIKNNSEMHEALKNPNLDLVLSNYRLKDFGAIEALGLLEKSGVVVPFIIFSDTLHSSDYNEAFRAGASSIISWEDIDGLNAIINQELGLRPVGLSAADQFFEALRESENWYQTIFDHIHDGIAILKYGKVEYVSDRALEIFGCTRESYEQYIGFDFAVPEERSYLLQLLVEIRQKDIFQDDLEFWIIAQDGTRRCVHNRFSIIHRGDEDSYQLVIMTDITHRKKTEQALRVSEERHRIISDLVSDYAYSFRIEPDGTYKPEWLTDAFTRITGFSTPEEIDSFAGLLSLIHMEDQSLASRYGERIMSGEPTVSEFRIVAKNGEVRWIRDYSLPVWDDRKGRVVRLFGAAQDITQRKAVQEALEQSEIRNKAILEASPDWVFHVSRTGIILDYKPGRERDLFKSLNISPGNKLKEVFPQELVEVIQEHIRKTFENKDVQVFEFKMSFPDGERHFEASMVSASQQDVLIFAHDISERARLEKMKSDFINRASHELRTPLTGAILMSDLIQQGGTDDELAEYWHHLRSELDRQRSLIERLLTVGRLETGSLKLNPVPLNILPILEEAVSSVYPMAALKDIQIQKDVNGDVPDVIGDKGGLEQVFTNLLNNAVKFSNNDGEVKIIVQNNNNGVSVWVKDQGVGIPENDLPNLFEGFFRAQNAMDRGIPGSGVGLYIVKSIITELGGTVNAESVLDVGTTFEVWLPAFSG